MGCFLLLQQGQCLIIEGRTIIVVQHHMGSFLNIGKRYRPNFLFLPVCLLRVVEQSEIGQVYGTVQYLHFAKSQRGQCLIFNFFQLIGCRAFFSQGGYYLLYLLLCPVKIYPRSQLP